MADVLEYLLSKNLPVKQAGGTEVHMPCFFCGEDPGARGRLYVNVDSLADIPGLFHCFLCGEKGAFPSLQRHFGDEPKKEVEDESWDQRREIWEAAADFYHDNLTDFPDVYKWLRGPERGLTFEAITKYKIGYATGGLYRHLLSLGFRTREIVETGLVVDRGDQFVDSLVNMVTVPYFVVGNVVLIRGRAWPYDGKGPKYKTPPHQPTRLFNSDAVWDAKELILTEGEFDCIAVQQLGFPNVVAVPGANVWQDGWDDYLSKVRRVYTIFDNDDAGSKGQKKLIERMGRKIRPISLSETEKLDPTEWITRGGNAEQLKAFMVEAMKGGLLLTVDDAHAEFLGLQGVEGIKLGFEQIDRVIAPGLLPAQVMVVLAKTGQGKSILLLNVLQRAAMADEQRKFLFVSLEQTRGDWFERARRIYRFYNLSADDEESLDYWRDRLMIVDKNRLSEEELLNILDDFEDRMNQLPDLILLDYLGYWAQNFRGERYERTSDAIMTLKAIAKDRRIAVVTPHQLSRTAKFGEEPEIDNARDAGVIEETADFVLTLWSPDAQLGRPDSEKQGLVNIRIGKSRHGGSGKLIKLQFAPLTLTLLPTEEPLASLAANELDYEREALPWEEALFRHRRGIRPVSFAR